jgi:hypothetical protein
MKKIFVSLLTIAIVFLLACNKSDSSGDSNSAGTLVFSSLVPQDTVMKVNGITSITANATGSGLTYHWTASYGTFIGSASTVQWTVCHSDKFRITCEVKDDQGHSASKEVSIHVVP